MRKRILILAALFSLAGCSLFGGSGPTSTVERFISNAESGDVADMTKLFSQKAIKEKGEVWIRANSQSFADLSKSAQAAGAKMQMEKIKENVNGDKATVSFLYRAAAKDIRAAFIFELSKENGEWKIDDIHRRLAFVPLGRASDRYAV